MYETNRTHDFAENYAKRTIQYGVNFNKWLNSSTDLYVILYGLTSNELDDPDSEKFLKNLPFGHNLLIKWLRGIASDKLRDSDHRAFFVRLDFNFKINNSSIKAIRRLVMDWKNLSQHEKGLATTRLLQLLRARAPKSEILANFINMARDKDLILGDVCDPETGIGCGNIAKIVVKEPEKKKSSFLIALASVAAGVAVSNMISHKDKK
jgi:hypothetical protein